MQDGLRRLYGFSGWRRRLLIVKSGHHSADAVASAITEDKAAFAREQSRLAAEQQAGLAEQAAADKRATLLNAGLFGTMRTCCSALSLHW